MQQASRKAEPGNYKHAVNGGQNRDIHLTFSGPILQRSYQVHVSSCDVTTKALHHDYQASLCSAVLGNHRKTN